MITLNKKIWNELFGVSNPLEYLMRLYANADDDQAWKELWDKLHHQGDIWQVSYAAVPHLLEIERQAKRFNWNGFALIAVIEQHRPANDEPEIGEIADGYKKAWENLLEVVAKDTQKIWNEILTASILSCIAYSRGQRTIACAALKIENERIAREFLKWHQEIGDEAVDKYIYGE